MNFLSNLILVFLPVSPKGGKFILMAYNQLEVKRFLRTLPKMKMFWGCLISLMMGLGLASWFFLRVLDAPLIGLLVGILWATLVAMCVIVYMCYQFYTDRLTVARDASDARAIVLREIIVATPLLLGAIGIFYFLTIRRFPYITPVVISSLGLWLVLRFFFRRRIRKRG